MSKGIAASGLRHWRRRGALALAALLAVAGGLDGAAYAEPGATDKVVRTKLPYWRVGDIDRKLSVQCSLGSFNQRVPYKLSGQFAGPMGPALLGAAKGSGMNLFDPKKLADPKFDYWFFRDRTSNCIVFKARVKAGQPATAPALPSATG